MDTRNMQAKNPLGQNVGNVGGQREKFLYVLNIS